MTGPRHEDAVRRSALAWLKRLGWNYLSFDQYTTLTEHPDNVLLNDRLRAIVRRCRHMHDGRPLSLSEEAVERILRRVGEAHVGTTWSAASAATWRLLQTGVSVDLDVPGGERITRTIPLIDWAHPNRNHWDVAEDLRRSGDSRAPGVRDLVCFVNGIPVVLIACVERDSHRHWGRVEGGICHLLRGMDVTALEPPPRQAQLLISLDRREARYAGVGVPMQGWTRWREPGWDKAAVARLRAVPVRQPEGPPDVPLAPHAELLAGLLTHKRLLRLLHHYMQAAPTAAPRLARAAQYAGVEAALGHLRAIARRGRNSDAQVCLAAGTGLQRAREWLAAAVSSDEAFAGFRLLMPVRHLSRSLPGWAVDASARPMATAARQLRAFFEAAAPPPLEVCAEALLRWEPLAHASPAAGQGVVVLLDADCWTHDSAALNRLRQCLREATWLTFAAAPVVPRASDPGPGTVIYQYDDWQAIADGVVVPVVAQVRAADVPPVARAQEMLRHFHDHVLHTQRDLRALLLVSTHAQACVYQQAFEQDGRLRTRVRHLDAQGHGTDRVPAVPPADTHVEICSGSLPAVQEARLGVVYLEHALAEADRARLLGLINQPHPDKHSALLVHGPEHAFGAVAGEQTHLPAFTPMEHRHLPRRLHALLPDVPWQDFEACLQGVTPHWELTALGDDRDAHRRRRHLLRRRITKRGLVLQHATTSADKSDARRELQAYAHLDTVAAQRALENGNYSGEDLRVRQWLNGSPHEVRESPMPYPLAQTEPDAAQQAAELYASLRQALEHPGEEPARAEAARRELQAVLRDHPQPGPRLCALQQLRDRLSGLLGHGGEPPRSRAQLLLEGVLGSGMETERQRQLVRQIDANISAARRFLPAEPRLFRQHVRAGLRSLLEQEYGAARSELILEALMSRAPHWPPPD